MSASNKILQAAAGNAAGEGLYVEEVFSTYLYDGTGSAQTITNGIDLDGEGGLVWGKCRSTSRIHALYDTERGVKNRLRTNDTNAEDANIEGVTSFNSNGFTLGTDAQTNFSGNTFASWTFRKAPKFFDVVTYTGTGTSQTISHNLGSAPGCLIIKRTDSASNWFVYHRGLTSAGYGVNLNTTAAESVINWFNFTAPTSTQFLANGDANTSGGTYVAYLFAHNDGDGDFGESGDQDIIKCGSFTTGTRVELGFEPQFLLTKLATGTETWIMVDSMRGMPVTSATNFLQPNDSAAETGLGASYTPDATGFTPTGFTGGTHIYIAIRRGPMKTPESGTEVFAVDTQGTSVPSFSSGFPVDATIFTDTDGFNNWWRSRLTGDTKYLASDSTNAEATNTGAIHELDNSEGVGNFAGSADATRICWMFRRAPGFFDVVAYTGNGTSSNTISHNLGVVPELMIVKRRNATQLWAVYTAGITSGDVLFLNGTDAATTLAYFPSTPTATSFEVATYDAVNASASNYIAYLFATLPGVSKVGSYTGNGSSQTIDCGFSAGARFVLIKRTDSTGDWHVYDSERGIVAGNDPRLELNTTDAEDTGSDDIDPVSSGFSVTSNADVNTNSASYVFLAIS